MSKTLQTRIQLKHDTETHWTTAGENGFIPLAGEIIIYDSDDNNLTPRVKIGDAQTNINNLPFIAQTPDKALNAYVEGEKLIFTSSAASIEGVSF